MPLSQTFTVNSTPILLTGGGAGTWTIVNRSTSDSVYLGGTDATPGGPDTFDLPPLGSVTIQPSESVYAIASNPVNLSMIRGNAAYGPSPVEIAQSIASTGVNITNTPGVNTQSDGVWIDQGSSNTVPDTFGYYDVTPYQTIELLVYYPGSNAVGDTLEIQLLWSVPTPNAPGSYTLTGVDTFSVPSMNAPNLKATYVTAPVKGSILEVSFVARGSANSYTVTLLGSRKFSDTFKVRTDTSYYSATDGIVFCQYVSVPINANVDIMLPCHNSTVSVFYYSDQAYKGFLWPDAANDTVPPLGINSNGSLTFTYHMPRRPGRFRFQGGAAASQGQLIIVSGD